MDNINLQNPVPEPKLETAQHNPDTFAAIENAGISLGVSNNPESISNEPKQPIDTKSNKTETNPPKIREANQAPKYLESTNEEIVSTKEPMNLIKKGSGMYGLFMPSATLQENIATAREARERRSAA